MAQSFAGAWRSFWHTMTSSDRHASHNSPYRTGQHVALPQSRHSMLTSVATDAADSRTDLALPEATDSSKSPNVTQTAYTPGLRSTMQRSHSDEASSRNQQGEIQMQSFSDGLPPPPPVSHSWQRIERWVEDNYEELHDNLSEGCTQNDINDLEHDLDCTLPMDVRESLQIHDGQERGGLPTGIIFGCMLLDCEEIVQEWKNWRLVNEEYFSNAAPIQPPTVPSKAFSGPSSSTSPPPLANQAAPSMWREELLGRQDSQPSNAIQKAYAHISWIPLARDWGGNCLAIDLAPGPSGKWGQVIIMGRDYDCKYVVGRSWASFLATVADDMSSPKVFVQEDTGELKLREFRQQGVEPAYLNILRWRTDQRYGRKGPARKPMNGELRVNPNAPPAPNRGSPYSSSSSTEGERGPKGRRSKGMAGSPRLQVSSPLARVAEEPSSPVKINSAADLRKSSLASVENLISPNSPKDAATIMFPPSKSGNTEGGQTEEKNKENQNSSDTVMSDMRNVDLNDQGVDDMKTLEI